MNTKRYPEPVMSFKEENDRILACYKHVTLSSIVAMTGMSLKRVSTVLKLKKVFHLTAITPADEYVSN